MILVLCSRQGSRACLQYTRHKNWQIIQTCSDAVRMKSCSYKQTNILTCSSFSCCFMRSLHIHRQNFLSTTVVLPKRYQFLPHQVFYSSSTDSLPKPGLSEGNESQAKTPTLDASQRKPAQQIGDPPIHPAASVSPFSTAPSPSEADDPKEIIVKVQMTNKVKPKTDFTQIYTANIYIPVSRAMSEYLLESSELDSLPNYTRRSPYPERDNITVFRRRDLEQRAIDKWGSLENLQLQKDFRRDRQIAARRSEIFLSTMEKKEYKKEHASSKAGTEKPFIYSPIGSKEPTGTSMFQHGSGRVVLYAIFINTANCVMKFVAWLYTGSHSMFSEFVHSFADTMNQIILAAGIRQSLKQPDLEHPYGWANFRNVASLISGVGIFCVGAGLSFYHGIVGLIYPAETSSLFWALATLGGSFVSEGATLLVAVKEIHQSSRLQKMSFMEYVFRGRDPSTNVVLLEDAAAVVGISIAATCISITHFTGSHVADACGSLLIGTLLGGVASFIIYTNTIALVGRSIPAERRMEMMRELESDRMIRTIHDLKATDVGGRYVKFKAEVDFDGREITRKYLEQQDLEKMLLEMQGLKSLEDAESFMLMHGENIVDTLGSEVDRIEKTLKKRHPEIRHCDLEQL